MHDALLLAAGLAALLAGGELLVTGALRLAARFGLPAGVAGLVVIGFGTSTPELAASVQAALAGAPGIAVGNVVGSNIVNVLLILAVAALIRPVAAERRALRRDGAWLAGATTLAILLCLRGEIDRIAAAALLAGLALFLWTVLRGGDAEVGAEVGAVGTGAQTGSLGTGGAGGLGAGLWRAAAGLALVMLGARLAVDGGVALAAAAGVSEAVIGLTVVAAGTSLPELAAGVAAARRGEGAVVLGNVIGSNVFNILAILGTAALVAPLAPPAEIVSRDIWVMAAAAAALIAAAWTGARVGRAEGALMLAGLVGWLALIAAV